MNIIPDNTALEAELYATSMPWELLSQAEVHTCCVMLFPIKNLPLMLVSSRTFRVVQFHPAFANLLLAGRRFTITESHRPF